MKEFTMHDGFFDNPYQTVLVTGGAGFIGSALIRYIIHHTKWKVINIDKLTYAASLDALQCVQNNSRYTFYKVDICNFIDLQQIFNQHKPNVVMHLAAESHVDRSINCAKPFIETNIVGTYNLLEVVRNYLSTILIEEKQNFRFLHISTDEVYGTLGSTGLFTEESRYEPNSPYSASKAASDHLVRAWHHTYGIPVLTSNCSNNFGIYQSPEKFIPVVILNALLRKSIPIYGAGNNTRDWLYVDDHVRALLLILQKGNIGETYNIGCNNELKNINLAYMICRILDDLLPLENSLKYESYIKYVDDRPGHDLRYAIDGTKIKLHTGWEVKNSFNENLKKTVQWYIENQDWCNIAKQRLLLQ